MGAFPKQAGTWRGGPSTEGPPEQELRRRWAAYDDSSLWGRLLDTGGEVYVVRPEDISSSTWIAPAVAGLRFTLA